MNHLTKMVSLISLGFVLVPSLLFFIGAIELNTAKLFALIGTFAWFVATPLWMSRKLPIDASKVKI